MKIKIPFFTLLIVLLSSMQSCREQINDGREITTKETIEETEKIKKIEVEDTIKLPKDFKSQLRPNQKIEIKKIYTDTVHYIGHEDGGDYGLFFAEKNNKEITLVHNTDSIYSFVKGDTFIINWKADQIIHAGDEELIDFSEFLVSFIKISAFKLKDKNEKVLWRENVYSEDLKTEVNTIILNKNYIKNITDPEKAALAYVATFIGNECEWEGKANEDRSNLKCMILSALDLGYQCSNTHKYFLQKWFSNDAIALKNFKECITMPNTASVQTTFEESSISTKEEDQTIQITYKVNTINTRKQSFWSYWQTDKFKYDGGTITLIDSKKTEEVPISNATNKNSSSFVVSCGSGCAMTYSETKVVENVDNFEATFKIETHVDEALTNEYYLTYIINYDASNKIESIQVEDEGNDPETPSLEIMENLKLYAFELIQKSTNN